MPLPLKFMSYAGRKLLEKYSSSSLVEDWLENHKYPSNKEIEIIFLKAAGDFKAGKVGLEDFSYICMDLYFTAYLGDSQKWSSASMVLEPDLDPRIQKALSNFSDPADDMADEHWHLKKEFHDELLDFVE